MTNTREWSNRASDQVSDDRVSTSAGAETAPSWAGQDRRRAGRIVNASPALIELMRRPASDDARSQIAMYDAPGFELPPARAAQRPRTPGFVLKVGVAVVASGLAWAGAFYTMYNLWGH